MKFGFCVIRVYEELCRPQGLLNLSPIDELGYWFQVEQGPDHLRHSKEVSMATRCEWEPPLPFSGNTHLTPYRYLPMQGGRGGSQNPQRITLIHKQH